MRAALTSLVACHQPLSQERDEGGAALPISSGAAIAAPVRRAQIDNQRSMEGLEFQIIFLRSVMFASHWKCLLGLDGERAGLATAQAFDDG